MRAMRGRERGPGASARAAALLLCALLVPSFPLRMTAEAGRVVLNEFSDGNSSVETYFPAAGEIEAASIRIPKVASLQRACVTVEGRPRLENRTIILDSRDDFASCALWNLDINSTPGSLRLLRREGLGDEFSVSSLDAKWSWFNEPPEWDVNSTRAGHLHMVSARNTQFHGDEDDGHIVYQVLNGSFMLETKLVSTPTKNYEKAGLVVRHDAGNYVLLKYQNNTGKTVQVAVKEAGSMWNDMTRSISATSPIWLRLEKDNRTFTSSYSTNGNSWTPHFQWSVTIADPVMVGLFVADGNAGTNYTADFDYFRVTQYAFNGSLLSPVYATDRPVLSAHVFWDGPVSPTNTGFVFSLRADSGAPWETMLWNSSAELQQRGTRAQFRIDMTSLGLRTPELYCVTLTLTAGSHPSGVSLALGGGAPFWNAGGELRGAVIVDFLRALADYIAAAPADGEGMVTVPLRLSSASEGYLVLRNLTVEYFIGAPPEAPLLISPPDGAFLPSLSPNLTLRSTDPDGDPLWYSVELTPEGSGVWQRFDQTTSGAGWSGGEQPYPSGENGTLVIPRYLAQGTTYLWRARAFDGAYWSPYSPSRRFTIDTTPPEGWVRDEGEITHDPSQLRAELNFSDPESGVELFEVSIGTSPGATDVVPTICSSSPEVIVDGLSLEDGPIYYINARARNRAGLWSAWAYSNGIRYHLPDAERVGIRIESPSDGSVLSGTVDVCGTAWNRDGWGPLARIQVRAGVALWRYATVSGEGWLRNWSIALDTTSLPDGSQTIQARLVQDLITGSVLAFHSVNVTVVNQGPMPELGADFSPPGNVTILENESVEFSVVNATLPVTYTWFVDGEVRAATTNRFFYRPSYTSAGAHTVTVVLSAGVVSLRHEWNVLVVDVNRPPVAIITEPTGRERLEMGRQILFDASTSYDPDPGDNLTFRWELGDGVVLEGRAVQHAYTRAGEFRVILIVSDGRAEATAEVELTVLERPRTIAQEPADLSRLAVPLLLLLALTTFSAASAYFARRALIERRETRRGAEAMKPIRIDLGLEEFLDESLGRRSSPRDRFLDDDEAPGFRELTPDALAGLPEAETELVEEPPGTQTEPVDEGGGGGGMDRTREGSLEDGRAHGKGGP
ncbi:MAG: PKD domain-containing protein [Thermoplasmata archaeon]